MAARTEYKGTSQEPVAQQGSQTVYKMQNNTGAEGQPPTQLQNIGPGHPKLEDGQTPLPHVGVQESQKQPENSDQFSMVPDLSVPGERGLSKLGDQRTIGRMADPAPQATQKAASDAPNDLANHVKDPSQLGNQPSGVGGGFKLSMAVDPADASQYSPSKMQGVGFEGRGSPSDMEEGFRGVNGIAAYNPNQIGAQIHPPLQERRNFQLEGGNGEVGQDSYSLIREGDSIIEKGQVKGPRGNAPVSTYGIQPGTGTQANRRAAQTVNATGEYQIKGNKALFTVNEQVGTSGVFSPYGSNPQPTAFTNPSQPPEPSAYRAVPPGSESLYKAVSPNQESLYKAVPPNQQSLYKAEATRQPAPHQEPPQALVATHPAGAAQPTLNVHDPTSPISSPRPQEEQGDALNDSNIANLSDSLNEAKSAGGLPPQQQARSEDEGSGQKNLDSGSKFQNDFGKYVKDEAGMSIFAPPDIDYQNRADKAEAHLLKYNTEVRGKLEIVLRGLQQIYSNIQKINLSSQESTNRFRTFFASFLKKAETVASSYHYKKDLRLLEEKKEMLELRTPGNLKTLASIFDTMKSHRETWIEDIVRDIGRLKQSYQSKVVEENFFEEGIDKKSTLEMSKLIEKTFESALKRNKECLKEFDDINKKLEENKIYFEKNKKFKQDTFEGYIDYLRSVHKMWGFLSEAQERMVKYWERVKKMETMRIKAISGLLMEYIGIEERLTTPSRALDSLRKLNQAMSPENMAASAYNDKAFLNSAIFESLGFNMNSIDHFTQEIKRLKTRTPEIVEFALWDYMNQSMLVKNESKSIRIFRSNENYLYIYETGSREDVIMNKPVYKCKVNNLILQFDNRNNFITLKGSGMFDFSSFSFNLREHQDAQDLVNYVVKFASNGQDLLKTGVASNPQK